MAKQAERTSEMTNELELDPKIQDVLGRSLKAHFDDILAAPMPDRFLVLLSELEAKEKSMSGTGTGRD